MKARIKEVILETAWKMIRRHGINKTSLDDVARSAMVAKATIYNYFGSKDQVYKEALDRKIGFMAEQLNQAVASLSSPLEKLNVFIRESMKITHEEAFLFTDEQSQSQRFLSKLAAARERFFAVQERLLQGILDEGVKEGVFPAHNIARASKFIGYLLRGLSPAPDKARNPTSDQTDIHAEAASLFDLLCHGLLSREGKT
jgi:AcrR family transcriptional regulator